MLCMVSVIIVVGCDSPKASENSDNAVQEGRAPTNLLNKDILALPEAERTAWIHGAASALLHSYAQFGSRQTGCIKTYLFEGGEGLKEIVAFMKARPDMQSTSSIIGAINSACSAT